MTETAVMGRGALRSLPSNQNDKQDAGPLSWLASYCGVEPDLVSALPVSAEGNQVAFTFGNLPVRKLRTAGTKDIVWDPTDAACPPLWPLPDATTPERIWLLEGETDRIIGMMLGLDSFALTKGAETPFSHVHASALKRRGVLKVAVCLDADSAGRKGTAKLAKVLLEAGLEVVTVDLASAGLVDPLLGQKDLRDAWLVMRERDALRAALERAAGEVHHLHIPRLSEGGEHGSDPMPIDLSTVAEPGPVEFVVEDFLPKGYPSNLYADSGQGKSYVGLHLALSIVTDKPFLGRSVVHGNVLYLDWELDSGMQRRRWGEVCRGHGLESLPAGLFYRRMKQPLIDSLDEIVMWQASSAPILTIVDSVGKALGDDPLNHDKNIKFYSALDSIGTVLNIDHQPKPGGETGYAAKWEFGSSYKRHLARSSWQLERVGADGSKVGLLLRHKKSNFGPLLPDIYAAMSFESMADGRQVVKLEAAEGVDAVSAVQFGLRACILEVVRGENMTVENMAVSLDNYDIGSIRNEVTELKRAGLLVIVGREGRAPIYGIA